MKNKLLYMALLVCIVSCSSSKARKSESKQEHTMANKQEIVVKGQVVDEHTRCIHYHSVKDIIAIRMKCCNEYYPCIECHREAAGHLAVVWPKKEFDTKAVLCGMCYHEMTINEYLKSNNQCPKCAAAFNPGCAYHYHLYFDMEPKTKSLK